jgi:hypothetical protein
MSVQLVSKKQVSDLRQQERQEIRHSLWSINEFKFSFKRST